MALTKYFEDLITRFLSGGNFDMRGKRIINAGRSVDNKDYITREEVMNLNSVINGSLINNLDASKITTGTLANARLNIVKSTWTPNNLHVALSVNSAKYWNLDSLVVIQCDVAWPVTADANGAFINGSPFSASVNCGLAVVSTGGACINAYIDTAGVIHPFDATGTPLTNAGMSNKQLILAGVFL